MDGSLEKWERWLEQSLRLDTGYQKIQVRAVAASNEDAVVRRNGDVFDVEVCAAIRTQPERFKQAYEEMLSAIVRRVTGDD
jgi:hypothetical protein